ncbi:MAG TPA: hypothetical protein VFM55_24865 [Micromonosporaceae bacterium]|nr:hypothetical protein [Micromonosporaceae bacterium]
MGSGQRSSPRVIWTPPRPAGTGSFRRRAVLVLTVLACLLAGAPPAYAGESGVLFGALVSTRGTETFADAVARQDAAYGTPVPMPISRVFYRGAVQPWPGNAGLSRRPVVVSFRYLPRDVLAGRADAALRDWFAHAPSYDVWWSYSHEPEDNIARGEFTAADYRAAWQRISGIAKAYAPATGRLHSTLILMCYTMNPNSHRNWLSYYVPTAQSTIAFDCYNHASKQGRYGDPRNIFKPVTDWSAANPSIPWGISEFGSVKVSTDIDGSGRAAWLRSVGRFLAAQHAARPTTAAIFGIYFDVVGPKGTDYRLTDTASKLAWRDVVQHY